MSRILPNSIDPETPASSSPPPYVCVAHARSVSTQLPNMRTTTSVLPYVSALLLLLARAAPILGLPGSARPQARDCARDQVAELVSSITSDFLGKLDAPPGDPCSGGPVSSSCTSDTIVYRRE